MVLEPDDLIREYYEQSEQYGLDYEHFSMICKTPFLFFRKMMELPELPVIKVKYFGKFLIFPGKAKSIIKALTAQLSRGEITEEEFQSRTVNLKNHIDEGEDSIDLDGEATPD